MAVEKTKHAFVDDNPYLVYSGEPDTSVDNAGGGGGGGGDGVFRVQITQALDAWSPDGTELTADVEPLILYQAVLTHGNVLVIAPYKSNKPNVFAAFDLKNIDINESRLVYAHSQVTSPNDVFIIQISPSDGFTGIGIKTT